MDTLNAPMKRRSPKLTAAKILIAIFVCVFVGAGLIYRQLDRDPSVTIPTYMVPSPNAFDGYARATALLRDAKQIDLRRDSKPLNSYMSLAIQEQVMRDNAPAVAAMRQAFAHPYLTPPARTYPVIAIYLPHDREFARLLAVQADIQASHGQWGASAQSSLDGLRMGADVRRGGGTMHMLAGFAQNAIARKPLRRAIKHLTLPETRSALTRLQTIDADPWTLTQSLQEEKWSQQANLMGLYRFPNWRDRFFEDEGYLGDSTALRGVKLAGRFTSKRRVMGDYTQYMDKVIAEARAHRPISSIDPSQSDVFSGVMLFLDQSKASVRYDNNQAQNAFLEIDLALHAYELQHHAYPQTLTALTPDLLPSIPGDPFAPGQSLRYRKTTNSYVLYSVGPDGVDDGGKAINKPTPSSVKAGHPFSPLLFDSKGDVVSGVNP